MALQMAMTLAGTFPALGYLFLKKIYGENIRTRYYVYLLRLGVLFFLCPFQYFKFQFLPIAWTEIFDIQLYWDVLMKKLFGYSFVSIPSGDGYYYIISEKYFYLWILWFVIVAVALLIYLFWYLYMKWKIMRHSVEREGQCTGSRGTGRRGTGSFSKWRACARQEESTLAAETDSQNI